MKTCTSIIIIMLILLTQSAIAQLERQQVEIERKFVPKVERHLKVFSQVGAINSQKVEEPKLLQMNYQDLWYNEEYRTSEEWMDSYRTIMEYEGEYISEVHHEWYNYSDNEWVLSNINYYEFENGMIRQVLHVHTNYETGLLENDKMTEFSYIFLNGRYYLSQMIFSRWNSQEDDWIPQFKAEPTYDSVGLLGVQAYDFENGEFVLNDRSVFAQQGNHVVEVIEEWNGDSFEYDLRITYLDTQRADLYDMLTSEMFEADFGYSLMRYFLHPLPNMIEEIWDGNEWVYDVRISYITEEGSDASNYIFRYLGEEFWDDIWDERYMVEFPVVDGLVMSATSYFGYDGFLYPDEREELTYDHRGLVIWSYVGYSDGEDGFNLDERVNLIWSGSDVSAPTNPDLPLKVSLGNAYPNPFNPVVNVPFELSVNAHVTLEVFDIMGRKVSTLIDSQLYAGVHTVRLNASNLASGIYTIRLQVNNQVLTSKITLVK